MRSCVHDFLVVALKVGVVKYIVEMHPGCIIQKFVSIIVCIPGCKNFIRMIDNLITILTQ